jgi:hypothetical protein
MTKRNKKEKKKEKEIQKQKRKKIQKLLGNIVRRKSGLKCDKRKNVCTQQMGNRKKNIVH